MIEELALELWRHKLLDITFTEQDMAHRQTNFLTVKNVEAMNEIGWPFPVSADATTRWLTDVDL